MENMKNMKLPSGGGGSMLARALVIGGAAVYGVANSLFNVEGGHRCDYGVIKLQWSNHILGECGPMRSMLQSRSPCTE